MDLPIITIGKRHTKRSYSDKPPYTERYVRWCEETAGKLIPCFLLDHIFLHKFMTMKSEYKREVLLYIHIVTMHQTFA